MVKDIFRKTNEFLGREVTVNGWIRTLRHSKSFGFIEVNDGSFFTSLQVVFEADILDNFSEIAACGVGTALSVTGFIELTPQAKQPFELKAKSINIEGSCPAEYPLQKKRHSLEYLRTKTHLRARTNMFSAVFRIRSAVAQAIHSFYNDRNFVYIHTPIITSADCEGAGDMFSVTSMDLQNIPKTPDGKVDFSKDLFSKHTHLTVSGQLEAEAFALAFSKVYTFGPTFRAENSNTARHASEFWMNEPEIAFADLSDDMALASDLIKYIINYIIKFYPEEMEFFYKFIQSDLEERLNNVLTSDFGHVSYTEAIGILEKSGKKFEFPVKWGLDLQSEHERYLTEQVFEKPVFVTDYPKDIKAFYMRMGDDEKTVAAMDLLVPGVGELIGGSQREERPEMLEKRIVECGMSVADYPWYMELRKFGGVKHAGFGLGFERMIMYVTGMNNIRDVQLFPRVPGNAQ